jgi:hypothetical protein
LPSCLLPQKTCVPHALLCLTPPCTYNRTIPHLLISPASLTTSLCFGKGPPSGKDQRSRYGKLSSTPCLDSRLGSYSLRTDTSGDPVNSIECALIFRRKVHRTLWNSVTRGRRGEAKGINIRVPHQLLLTLGSLFKARSGRREGRREERLSHELFSSLPGTTFECSKPFVRLGSCAFHALNQGWQNMYAHSSSPGLQ